MERIPFMNFEINNITLNEGLTEIEECIEQKKKMYIVTPNVDHAVKLQKNKKFLEAYQQAGMVAVDGTPIMWASKLYGRPLKEKIVGVRLTETTIKLAAERGYTVFFLGGMPGVAVDAAERMLEKYPSLKVVGTYSPALGFEQSPEEIRMLLNIVNNAQPDIVIAAMSSPKTEIFLCEHYQEMQAWVSMSTGAAIDFMAGNVKRCPPWMNRVGLEWFYRFLQEPRRMFKRYFIDDVAFLWLLWKYRKGEKRESDSE